MTTTMKTLCMIYFLSLLYISILSFKLISNKYSKATKNFAILMNVPRPNIITPSNGNENKLSIEKFLMMYTCKICSGRNAQMISKVAYANGMVVSTCRHCRNLHLIADNEGKMDMAKYGKKIEDYLKEKGENVQKMSLSEQDLEDNYLIDKDGVVSLVPKIAGQPSADVNIIDYQIKKSIEE